MCSWASSRRTKMYREYLRGLTAAWESYLDLAPLTALASFGPEHAPHRENVVCEDKI